MSTRDTTDDWDDPMLANQEAIIKHRPGGRGRMRACSCVGWESFPCTDVVKDAYSIPDVELDPDSISMAMVSEAAPQEPAGNYHGAGNPLFQRTTVQPSRMPGSPSPRPGTCPKGAST